MSKPILFLLICLLAPFTLLWGQTGIPTPGMSSCDNLVTQFLAKHNIPGATFAMAKNGKLVYMRAFGEADLSGSETTQPHHLFRIASVSKPITSIGIMQLVEDGQLSLSDKVFGPGSLLGNHPVLGAVTVSDQRIYDITVQHLLEHSAGWDRDVSCVPNPTSPYPWFAGHCDPIGFPLHVTQTLGVSNPVTKENLIQFLMQKGLVFAPGTNYAYSNIGYLVLGEVVEAVTGKTYEEYMTEDVLAPLGICDMHIGKNRYEDKQEREAEYHGNGYTAPSIYGTGLSVPWEYGGWNLEAMDAHGGWIATSRDLVRLLVAVDGFSTKPDILSSGSINTMVAPSANAANYAKGWQVNAFNNWWHTGALDGTASIWARTGSGYTWAIILNKRVIDNTSNTFWGDFDALPWSCISQSTGWPTFDLLDFPSLNSSDISFSVVNDSSLTISWQAGNGSSRILVVREGSPVDAFPLDGSNYQANPVFGLGNDLGNGNFVVMNGATQSTLVTGLDASKTYHFRLFDYNQSANTGNHALYHLCESPTASATTASVGLETSLEELGVQVFPNPTNGLLRITWNQPGQLSRVELRNAQGQVIRRVNAEGMEAALDLAELPDQVYLLTAFGPKGYLGSQRIVKKGE